MMDSFLLSSHQNFNMNDTKDVAGSQAPAEREAPIHVTNDYNVQMNTYAEIVDEWGYMFIITDKDEYSPGELIKGKVILELFYPCPQKELNMVFKGIQRVPEGKAATVDPDHLQKDEFHITAQDCNDEEDDVGYDFQ